MKRYSVNAQQWIASAEMVNEIVDGELDIEFTSDQKEFLEDKHMKPLDDFCERRFQKTPHTYRFEPFFNGLDDVFICTAYFD